MEQCVEFTPLPNAKWLRSDKMPEWALCFDPDNAFYGWKMYANHGTWVSGGQITEAELKAILNAPHPKLVPFIDDVKTLLEQLKGESDD